MDRREAENIAEASVAMLAQAWRTGEPFAALNATPISVTAAHSIQDRVAAQLGEAVGGFKANAPPGEDPVRGLIFARNMFATPKVMPAGIPHKGVEGEIAFRFLTDLPPRDTAYSRAEIIQSVVALAAIEVVSGRLIDPRSRPTLEQLADSLNNGALVLGPDIADWASLDIENLPVTAQVNGEVIVQQTGGHPIGDPVAVAVALANMMRSAGGVKAGQVITTGSCTGIKFLEPGDRFSVTFEGLGGVEVAFAV